MSSSLPLVGWIDEAGKLRLAPDSTALYTLLCDQLKGKDVELTLRERVIEPMPVRKGRR